MVGNWAVWIRNSVRWCCLEHKPDLPPVPLPINGKIIRWLARPSKRIAARLIPTEPIDFLYGNSPCLTSGISSALHCFGRVAFVLFAILCADYPSKQLSKHWTQEAALKFRCFFSSGPGDMICSASQTILLSPRCGLPCISISEGYNTKLLLRSRTTRRAATQILTTLNIFSWKFLLYLPCMWWGMWAIF